MIKAFLVLAIIAIAGCSAQDSQPGRASTHDEIAHSADGVVRVSEPSAAIGLVGVLVAGYAATVARSR